MTDGNNNTTASIILRTYNRPKFLIQSLKSVEYQSSNNWELIIFDDSGSVENRTIIDDFRLKNPNNRIVYITTSTPLDLFKKSWIYMSDLSECDILIRLDDDDLLSKNCVKYLTNLYSKYPELDFSYGSSVFFEKNKLTEVIEGMTPYELPKTKTAWIPYTIENNNSWNDPFEFQDNYYEEPQNYTSIIHASKLNQLCVFHTYAIRTKSLIKIKDKINIESNYVDDLEMMGTLEYLGLKHTSVKEILTYVRNHNEERITNNIRDNIDFARKKVDNIRPKNFISNVLDISSNNKPNITIEVINDFLSVYNYCTINKKGFYYKDIKIADECYIINLPERTDRKKETKELLDKLNFNGYEFFNAIKLTDPDLKKMGCTQSFNTIFNKFLSGNSKNIIIFEDDIKLFDDVTEKELDEIFNNWDEITSNYDVVSLGTRFFNTTFKHKSRLHGSFEKMLCSQSFFYKRNFIEKYVELTDGILEKEHDLYCNPIDIILHDLSTKNSVYTKIPDDLKFKFGATIPLLFSQIETFSDNEKYIQNYDKTIQNSYWKTVRHDKSYVLYADDLYFETATECCKSIREFSNLPIIVYMLNSDKKIEVANTLSVRWDCEFINQENKIGDENYYINRTDLNIYKILIQRPLIIKDALRRFSKNVAYIDSDSIATKYVDRIFEFFDEKSDFPYFVEGIYDFLFFNGRGGIGSGNDFSKTLEAPACELFNVDQSVRKLYRQTGYFVSGQNCTPFLDEWYDMCIHPEILKNNSYYAPFHEETIVNVLLFKKNIHKGLPYLYVNGTIDTIERMYNEVTYLGPNEKNHIEKWLRIPQDKKTLLFFHGEKRPDVMKEMINKLKNNYKDNMEISENYKHFDFIEIGTSDFDTLIQNCDDNTVGLSIEPIKYYLDRLPNKKNVIKVNSALSENDGYAEIYYIDDQEITEYNLPYWVRGCNSISRPHEFTRKTIGYELYDKIVKIEQIKTISWKNLIKNYNIGSIDYLKIDTEGHEHIILKNYFQECSLNPNLYAKKIIFEYNETSNKRELDDIISNLNNYNITYLEEDIELELIPNNKIKLLFLAPHLSTGGMPAYVLKKIETLQKYSDIFDIFVAEYAEYSNTYVAQRNKIIEIIPEDRMFFCGGIGSDKSNLIKILKDNKIDILHVDEIFEGFDSFNKVPDNILKQIYSNDRTWKIVETCHNVWFNPDKSKKFEPDAYAFCTPYHPQVQFANTDSYSEVFEFPIENKVPSDEIREKYKKELGFDLNKKHILNVGIWTSGKNQGEGVEIARYLEKTNPELHFHFVGNQAVNFEEYWKPIMDNLPSNVTVWQERNDVDKFMSASDLFMFNSTWECNPLVLREAISHGLRIVARDLNQYMGMFDNYIHKLSNSIEENSKLILKLLDNNITYNIPENQDKEFALKFEKFYEKIHNTEIRKQKNMKENVSIIQNFINNPFLEIKGDKDNNNDYLIKFFDEKNVCVYENTVKVNHWVKLNREYYTKWNAKIWENGDLIYDNTLDYKGKRVYISFDSKSLGDTIAWIPYCLEFKKKHNCEVIVSTFWNNLFESSYPELEFVLPGTVVTNIYGMYKIGWFYNTSKEPELPNTIPLQKAITNILGLDYEEIIPEISFTPDKRPYEQKYITIATNSTAGLKFWQKEDWQQLINYLNEKGYKVINVSKEKNDFKNSEQLEDSSIKNTMNVIHHSEFFIGLSSGLSWLAWGLKKHVVMISNFTSPDHEFQKNCTRIINHSVCNSCWNNPNFKFDRGDWNWCPIWKNTDRHFECHKSITYDMVINKIKNLMK